MRAAKDGVGRAAALASRGLGSSATNHRPRHVWLTRQTQRRLTRHKTTPYTATRHRSNHGIFWSRRSAINQALSPTRRDVTWALHVGYGETVTIAGWRDGKSATHTCKAFLLHKQCRRSGQRSRLYQERVSEVGQGIKSTENRTLNEGVQRMGTGQGTAVETLFVRRL